jgi:hypothetical protein
VHPKTEPLGRVGKHAPELTATENTNRFTGMKNHEEMSWELGARSLELGARS